MTLSQAGENQRKNKHTGLWRGYLRFFCSAHFLSRFFRWATCYFSPLKSENDNPLQFRPRFSFIIPATMRTRTDSSSRSSLTKPTDVAACMIHLNAPLNVFFSTRGSQHRQVPDYFQPRSHGLLVSMVFLHHVSFDSETQDSWAPFIHLAAGLSPLLGRVDHCSLTKYKQTIVSFYT